MLRYTLIIGLFAFATTGPGQTIAYGEEAIKVKEMVPDLELQGSDGKTYRLSDFRDKQAVVIAWFPKAFTGG